MTAMTLTARLEALASEVPAFRDGARLLPGADVMHAILSEIDATILPASIRFQHGEAALQLHVSGRRVHRVLGATGFPAADRLDGVALGPEAAGRVAALLRSFALAGPGTPSARHDPPPAGRADGAIRVSVSQIAEALDRGPAPRPAASDAAAFRDALGGRLTAWIETDGATVRATSGATAALEALLRERDTPMRAAMPDTPSLLVLGEAFGPGRSFGRAVFGADALDFEVPTADLPQAFAAFDTVRASAPRS